MNWSIKRAINFLLLLILLVDLLFSFLQYYNTPLHGDIEGGVLPSADVQEILNDPFGFHAISSGEKHINPNRYFSHLFLMEYLQNAPLFLQRFVNPISSVYLSNAIFKIFVQLVFVLLMAGFISRKRNILHQNFLIAAIIVAPLFQVYGYWSKMGIVDKSIAYTFFYGFPLVLTMCFFLPFFKLIQNKRNIGWLKLLYIVPLSIILPFSGPLIPAVVLICTGIIFLSYFTTRNKSKRTTFGWQFLHELNGIPKQLFYLLPISILSLYSLYLGRYDLNYLSETIPIWDRYAKLPYGIYKQIFHSLGFPLMLIMIGINFYLIKRNQGFDEGSKLFRTLKWIGIFAVIYLLLLPFGGYRPYRPLTIRYDTFMPVNIALMYVFGASSWLIITSLQGSNKKKYRIALIAVLAVYLFSDTAGMNENKPERKALEMLANSKEAIVLLPNDCKIMSWVKMINYRDSEMKAELLYCWGIIEEKKLFYQKTD